MLSLCLERISIFGWDRRILNLVNFFFSNPKRYCVRSPASVLWADSSRVYEVGPKAWFDGVGRERLGESLNHLFSSSWPGLTFWWWFFSSVKQFTPNTSSVTQYLNLLLPNLFSEETPWNPWTISTETQALMSAECPSPCNLGSLQVGGRRFGAEGQSEQERACSCPAGRRPAVVRWLLPTAGTQSWRQSPDSSTVSKHTLWPSRRIYFGKGNRWHSARR